MWPRALHKRNRRDDPPHLLIAAGQAGCGAAGETDQRGVSRPQGGACDVGAFEFGFATISGTVSDTDSNRIGGAEVSVNPATTTDAEGPTSVDRRSLQRRSARPGPHLNSLWNRHRLPATACRFRGSPRACCRGARLGCRRVRSDWHRCSRPNMRSLAASTDRGALASRFSGAATSVRPPRSTRTTPVRGSAWPARHPVGRR